MNKKRAVFFLSILFGILLLSFIVSAAEAPNIQKTISQIQGFFSPILKAIFGQDTNIFELLLFSLLIIAACYMALDRVPAIRDNNFALWTIIIVMAILSTRYIGTIGAVQALLFPQGVFGIALLSILPFAMYFWFVEFGLSGARSRVLRMIAWIAYAIIFFYMWLKNYNNFGVSQSPLYSPATLSGTDFAWLYLLVGIASIAMLLFDRTIQSAISKSKQKNLYDENLEIIRTNFMRERVQLDKDLQSNPPVITATQFKTMLANLNTRAKAYGWKF